jgi:hypothetical protein
MELCRVSRWRVVVDFPRAASFAAIESWPAARQRGSDVQTEAYRVIAERDVSQTFRARRVPHRDGAPPVRPAGRAAQGIGRAGFTGAVERGLASVGLCDCWDRRSRWWPSGERLSCTGASGFTGGHLGAVPRRRGDRVRALVRAKHRTLPFPHPSIEMVDGDLTDAASLRQAIAGVDVVYNIAALYREAGLPASTTAPSMRRPSGRWSSWPNRWRQRVVHCSTVGVHGDSSIRRPTRTRRFARRRLSGDESSKANGSPRHRRARRDGCRHRASDRHLRPADRRCSKSSARSRPARFVMLGRAGTIYHVTYIDDLCEGFRLCGTVAAAAGRTYILAAGKSPRFASW